MVVDKELLKEVVLEFWNIIKKFCFGLFKVFCVQLVLKVLFIIGDMSDQLEVVMVFGVIEVQEFDDEFGQGEVVGEDQMVIEIDVKIEWEIFRVVCKCFSSC